MATPVKGGHGHGHHPVQGNGDGGKKNRKRKAGEGAGAAEDSAHVDKRAHKPPALSKAHQEYVTSFITELHATATESYTVTRAINLTTFFLGKKVEILEKREEGLSSVAAFRFVHTQPALKEKAIAGFEILDMASWKALEAATAWGYDPSAEPRIRAEVEAFCDHDPIAQENGWDKETIMTHVTGKDPKALIKHIFPTAKIG